MIQAMRLVQDEIRYVSLSMGRGSYVPRDPATVIRSGFGDCKDKALLLASALVRLGSSGAGRADRPGPGAGAGSASAGAAAISTTPSSRRRSEPRHTGWMPPTTFKAARREQFSAADYGFALPLFGNGGWRRCQARSRQVLRSTVAEDFSFPDRPDGHLTLSVLSTYQGADADGMRARLASRSVSDLSDAYLKYYSKRYPGIESSAKLEIFDNRDGNIINVRESYQLPAQALAANDLAKNFPIKASRPRH